MLHPIHIREDQHISSELNLTITTVANLWGAKCKDAFHLNEENYSKDGKR